MGTATGRCIASLRDLTTRYPPPRLQLDIVPELAVSNREAWGNLTSSSAWAQRVEVMFGSWMLVWATGPLPEEDLPA
jgi:hypothetical protein